MTDGTGAHDFDREETFRTAAAQRMAVRSLLLTPVIIFPIVLVVLLWIILRGLVLPAVGLPDGPLLTVLSWVLAVVIIAGIMVLWVVKQRAVFANSMIIASPDGLVMHESGITRSVRWEDMTEVGPVVPLRGLETSRGLSNGDISAKTASGINRLVQGLSASYGLLGYGTATADAGNAIAKRVLEVNRGVWGADAAGVPLVGIQPGIVGPDWFQGRLGDWLRHRRPDLAEQYARMLAGEMPK